MRFIHTSDWHLGRLMHGEHLTEDQAYVLDQMKLLARDSRPDALLVSGDVYDRAVPPPEAVALLDDFLSFMVLDLDIPVILIAGNHDSPSRLQFASRVLAGRNLHVFGSVRLPRSVTFTDSHGPVHVYAVPYAEPVSVREVFQNDEIRDHDSAMAALTDVVVAGCPADERTILVAHAFVAGGSPAESERPLSVGGAETVDASRFRGFHYVALGHLHRPQSAGSPRIQYPGSLLKYSFSEADHSKGVNLVEMDRDGHCRVERIPLTPRHDVRRIRGLLEDLLKHPDPHKNREDYLMISLLDVAPILDVMGRLKDVYPNVLHIERECLAPGVQNLEGRTDHRKINDMDLFAAFFSQVTGSELDPAEAAAYGSIVTDLRMADREAAET
ncbi:MAG TPA: exonuclease SbcCD subunit D [Desulfomonilaceae bacterium]|nr:exonuclease SbcCD subunit D [Desulfomonilaceae bacterium]